MKTRNFLDVVSFSARGEKRLDLSKDALQYLCFDFMVQDAEVDTFRILQSSIREYFEGKAEYDAESSYAFAARDCIGVFASLPSLNTESELTTMAEPKNGLLEDCKGIKDVICVNE